MFRQYFAHLAQLHIPYPSAAVTHGVCWANGLCDATGSPGEPGVRRARRAGNLDMMCSRS